MFGSNAPYVAKPSQANTPPASLFGQTPGTLFQSALTPPVGIQPAGTQMLGFTGGNTQKQGACTQPAAPKAPTGQNLGFGAPQSSSALAREAASVETKPTTASGLGAPANTVGAFGVTPGSFGQPGASASAPSASVAAPITPFGAGPKPAATVQHSPSQAFGTLLAKFQLTRLEPGEGGLISAITTMYVYASKSVDELRFEDYQYNNGKQRNFVKGVPVPPPAPLPLASLSSSFSTFLSVSGPLQSGSVSTNAGVSSQRPPALSLISAQPAAGGLCFSTANPLFGPSSIPPKAVELFPPFSLATFPLFGKHPSVSEQPTHSLFAATPAPTQRSKLEGSAASALIGMLAPKPPTSVASTKPDPVTSEAKTQPTSLNITDSNPAGGKSAAGRSPGITTETQTNERPALVDKATNTDLEGLSSDRPRVQYAFLAESLIPSSCALRLTLISLSPKSTRYFVTISSQRPVSDLKLKVCDLISAGAAEDVELIHDSASLRNATPLCDLGLTHGDEIYFVLEQGRPDIQKRLAPISLLPTCSAPLVTLTPSLVEMGRMSLSELTNVRQMSYKGCYGEFEFDGTVDVTGLDFDRLVQFEEKRVVLYPNCNSEEQSRCLNTPNKLAKVIVRRCEPTRDMSIDVYVRKCGKFCERNGVVFESFDRVKKEVKFVVRI